MLSTAFVIISNTRPKAHTHTNSMSRLIISWFYFTFFNFLFICFLLFLSFFVLCFCVITLCVLYLLWWVQNENVILYSVVSLTSSMEYQHTHIASAFEYSVETARWESRKVQNARGKDFSVYSLQCQHTKTIDNLQRSQ